VGQRIHRIIENIEKLDDASLSLKCGISSTASPVDSLQREERHHNYQ
jgi:hypothetical protein